MSGLNSIDLFLSRNTSVRCSGIDNLLKRERCNRSGIFYAAPNRIQRLPLPDLESIAIKARFEHHVTKELKDFRQIRSETLKRHAPKLGPEIAPYTGSKPLQFPIQLLGTTTTRPTLTHLVAHGGRYSDPIFGRPERPSPEK
jgi:hypothetical protein